MIYRIPVTQDEIQTQSFSLFGYHLTFTLFFNPISRLWAFDLYDQDAEDNIVQSAGLAVNAPVLIGKNVPFVVMMVDGSGLGINSLHKNELGNRLNIYFVDKEVYREAIRPQLSATAGQR